MIENGHQGSICSGMMCVTSQVLVVRARYEPTRVLGEDESESVLVLSHQKRRFSTFHDGRDLVAYCGDIDGTLTLDLPT